MARQRVEFRLSMSSRGNAVYSSFGEGRSYIAWRTVKDDVAQALMDPQGEAGRWYHRWDDGWAALVTARVMNPGERRAKSNGFAGYDWMIDNILRYGSPYMTGTTGGQTPAGVKR